MEKFQYSIRASERLVLLQMIPTEGNYLNLLKVRKVRESLGFNDDEIKRLENVTQQQNDGKFINFKKLDDLIDDKLIDFGEWLTNYIGTELDRLDRENKLSENKITLFEKFVKDTKKQ